MSSIHEIAARTSQPPLKILRSDSKNNGDDDNSNTKEEKQEEADIDSYKILPDDDEVSHNEED